MLTVVSNGTLFIGLSKSQWIKDGSKWVSNYANNGHSVICIAESGCEYHQERGTLRNGDEYVAAGPVHFLDKTENDQLNGVVYSRVTYQGDPATPPPSLSSQKSSSGYWMTPSGEYDDGKIVYRLFVINFALADRYGGYCTHQITRIDRKGESLSLTVTYNGQYSTGKTYTGSIDTSVSFTSVLRGVMCRGGSRDLYGYRWHGWPDTNFYPAGFMDQLFYDSYNTIPRLEMNNLDNVLRIAELCRNPLAAVWDICQDMTKDIKPSRIFDAWLEYRYSYNTSKADLEELQNNLVNVTDFQYGNNWFRCTKSESFVHPLWGEPFDIKLTYYAKPNQSPAAKFRRLCNAYGVAPTATNLWDMVPMSFIIDWFTTMDDFVGIVDIQQELKAQAYILTNFCISHTCRFLQPGTRLEERHFKRSVLQQFPFHYPRPDAWLAFDFSWIGKQKANTLRRTLDLAALFLS